MWNSRPVRILWHSFNWLTRVAIVCAATVAVLLAFGIIALRYWLLPDIESYHEKITSALTHAIGRPVTIEKISGDWDGLRPRLSLVNFSMLDERKRPALVLPSVNVSVSWLSLLTAELRFASLEINRPELLIRRDENGNLFVGSVAVAQQSSGGEGNSDLADWLLHQSRMVARNALIVWVDEQRGAPPLILEHVDVRIESLFNHHRFAVRAAVSTEPDSPLDVRGDFHGSSFSAVQSWNGQVFTQLPYADITAWRAWFDLPKELSRGRGALRGWLDVTAGKISRLQVDLGVRDVATKLADDVPEMMLRSLQGRATWHALQGGFELETKKLTMQLNNGVSLPTTDLYLRILNAQAESPASGEIRANLLQLETLVSLINFVPVPADLRAQLDAFAPRGKVENLHAEWQGLPQKITGFSLKGKFTNLALRQVGRVPGFAGLTADIDGNQESGKIRINAQQLYVDAPEIMREPISFNTVKSQASWQHVDKELLVNVSELAASNADAEGTAHGSFHTAHGTPGVLDLSVNLTRANVHQVARYTPLTATNRKLNDWLHDLLLDGQSDDFHLRILGNLQDFPFDKKDSGQFEIGANFQNSAVRFAKDWPIIEKAQGKFLMSGKRLEVVANHAESAGVTLHHIKVALPDFMIHQASLAIKLQASDDMPSFLSYVQHSPVRGYSKNFTDTIHAQGKGNLDLAINIADLSHVDVAVDGAFHFLNNEVDFGGRIPVLHKVNGDLQFTQKGLQTHQLSAQILGGPAQLEIKANPSDGVLGELSGTADLDVFGLSQPHPLFNFVHGKTAWNANIATAKNGLLVQIDSSLQGISSTLPMPFTKNESDALPLSLSVTTGGAMTNVAVELGKLLSARVVQQTQQGVEILKRAAVNFSGQGTWPEQDGIWLVGVVPELSAQGWEGLFGRSNDVGSNAASTPINIDGADLQITKLTGYGYTLNDMHVTASKRADGLVAQLSGPAMEGEILWQPHGYQNAAKLSARLKNLYWPAADSALSEQATLPENASSSVVVSTPLQPGNLPTVDVTIAQLQVSGKHLGSIELAGHPDGDSWRLRRLLLTNPDGSLSGDGVWFGGAGEPHSQLNLALEISSAEKILSRSGYPNTIKDGSGKLLANLAWVGAPEEFNLKTLNGTLKLDTGKGQFLKIDPSVSKVLGVLSVLSLQALPKHITLDFKDVFSEGFQFDNINGNAVIQSGNMTTQNFHIDGSAGKVLMGGNVDLLRETQDLRVEFLPSIGSGISLIGVLVINPVVGISAFVVDKMLGNPLDKLVSFEYNVSGTWTDPSVTKVGEKSIPIQVKIEPPLDATEPEKKPLPSSSNQPSAP